MNFHHLCGALELPELNESAQYVCSLVWTIEECLRDSREALSNCKREWTFLDLFTIIIVQLLLIKLKYDQRPLLSPKDSLLLNEIQVAIQMLLNFRVWTKISLSFRRENNFAADFLGYPADQN
jgi:hypothetical protein